ncbi:MAG: hypothetical protein VX589_20105 [Myxococcota bacterium]|nr:hypothetical protein [Myxococcota bacterium]
MSGCVRFLANWLTRLTPLTLLWSTFSCAPTKPPTGSRVQTPFSGLYRPQVHQDEWKKYRTMVDEQRPPPTPIGTKLTMAISALNRAEVQSVHDATKRMLAEDAFTRLKAAGWHFARSTSADYYMRMGRTVGLRMVDALVDFNRACTARQRTIADCLRTSDMTGHPYLELGGTLALGLETAGVTTVDESAMLPALAMGIFMQRWTGLVADKTSIRSYLSPRERRWYLRWQIEWAPFETMQERLKALEELSVLADYPSAWNGLMVLINGGKPTTGQQNQAPRPGSPTVGRADQKHDGEQRAR